LKGRERREPKEPLGAVKAPTIEAGSETVLKERQGTSRGSCESVKSDRQSREEGTRREVKGEDAIADGGSKELREARYEVDEWRRLQIAGRGGREHLRDLKKRRRAYRGPTEV
jgi:hypothetical protein